MAAAEPPKKEGEVKVEEKKDPPKPPPLSAEEKRVPWIVFGVCAVIAVAEVGASYALAHKHKAAAMSGEQSKAKGE